MSESTKSILDRVIEAVAPVWGAKRHFARIALRASYEAGAPNQNKPWTVNSEPGDSPALSEVRNARDRAWHLWRNNPYARKIVRALTAHICGCGMIPESMATGRDGKPNDAFRRASKELFRRWSLAPEMVGRPGRGGLTFGQVQAKACREFILGGEVLVRKRWISRAQQQRRGLPVPYLIELIEGERLAEDDYFGRPSLRPRENGSAMFRGIEFDPDTGERLFYHVYRVHPQSPLFTHTTEIVPIPADEIVHVYLPERTGQMRGVTWFTPGLLQLRDVSDYQQDELVAAAVSACVTMVIKTMAGTGGLGGLNTPTGGSSTNSNGDRFTRLAPGIVPRLQPGEDIVPFNPGRPNSTASDFINHLLRGEAGAFPGLKSSTLTGDYRNSSFSSERSADNDTWPETEQIQEWFADNFCQPIWDQLIEVGVQSNWFDKRQISLGQYRDDPFRFNACLWNGPVAKSINPNDDAQADEKEIAIGVGSIQSKAAARGYNWRQILDDLVEYIEYGESIGLEREQLIAMFFQNKAQTALIQSEAPAQQAKENANAA